jgi:hypothetical protein
MTLLDRFRVSLDMTDDATFDDDVSRLAQAIGARRSGDGPAA